MTSEGKRLTRRGWSVALAASVSAVAVPAFAQEVGQGAPQRGQTTLQEVVVEGANTRRGTPPSGTVGQAPAPYAGGQVATGARLGSLGNRPIQETPFNIVAYTEELIRDQMARTVADVTLNDPSVRADAPPFSERDSFFIRGISVTNLDTAYDGLFYITNPRRHFLDGIERVEILKGPSALVSGGLGRVGGTINLVPKRATDDPITRLTTGFATDSQVWTHLDVGRRYGPDNEWGVRFNGSYRNGDTPLDFNETEVGVASLGLDYRGERFRASLDLNHSRQKLEAPTSLFNAALPGIEIPEAPDGRINTANPFEYHDSTYNMAATRLEFDLFENTTIYAAGGVSRYREDFLTSSYTIQNSAGDALATLAIQPQQIQGLSGEVGIRSEFETGPVGHRVNLSVAQALNENYRGGFVPGAFPLPTYPTNIYDPTYLPDSAVGIGSLPRSDDLPLFADLLLTSVAVSDTLSFLNDRVNLTLGGRFQDVRSRAFNTRPDRGVVGTKTYEYEADRFSPAIAASARLTDELWVYANYVEGLTEGAIAPATATNAGEIFPPFVNTQKEIGVKYDFGPVLLTASLFEIELESAFTDPVTRVFSVDGLQVNRGLELTVGGEVYSGVRLLGGVTFLDATLERTAAGIVDGNDVPGVPDTVVSLYGEYDMPWLAEGLTMTGRVVYGGETFYDQANTQEIDDWTRVDLGLRYAFTGPHDKPVELRANVANVFNENYWASSARGFLAAGAPRTFTLSASFDF